MREKLVPLVSAAVVVLLQVVVAPVIAIYSVVPNFLRDRALDRAS